MCRYERDLDGTWHDGTLMDLLAEDLVSPDVAAPIELTPGADERSNTVSQLRLVVEVDDSTTLSRSTPMVSVLRSRPRSKATTVRAS